MRRADDLATVMRLSSRYSGSLNPLGPKGPLQPCTGIALPFHLKVYQDFLAINFRDGKVNENYTTILVTQVQAQQTVYVGREQWRARIEFRVYSLANCYIKDLNI